MTRDEALQHGFDVFEAALGSLTTAADVESGWKNLWRFKVGKHIRFVNKRVAFLEKLCAYMGKCAARLADSGPVTLAHVNAAFPLVQQYAYRINRGPTLLC